MHKEKGKLYKFIFFQLQYINKNTNKLNIATLDFMHFEIMPE